MIVGSGKRVEDAFHRLSVRVLPPMANTQSRCWQLPQRREAIGYKENIRQTVDSRELRFRIDENTDLNRLAYRAHVYFRPQNVGFDNINIRKSEIGFLVGGTFPE